MMTLKQFVPQKMCLSCDGCCRFDQEQSNWRPKVFPEKFSPDVETEGYIKAVACHSGFKCTFFNEENNTCQVYDHRPFECQLYPFLLSTSGENVEVAVHLSCPDVQDRESTSEFDEYINYLKDFFAQENVINFLKEHKHHINDYSPFKEELRNLFIVDLK